MATSQSNSGTPAAAPPPPSLPLDECIKSIILLAADAAARGTREQAALVDAGLGFSVQLARDQDAIATYLRNSDKDSSKAFPWSELPAMKALVTDPALFQSIISVLSRAPNPGGATGVQTATANTMVPGNTFQKQGRKRLLSEDLSNANRKKPMLSPAPPINRPHLNQAHDPSKECSKGQMSEKSVPAFAATIIYAVFQHVDHWPIAIIKAYAEDSFGPRNWVDDERCKALVSNLEASLHPVQVDGSLDQESSSAAEDAETYFSSLMAPIKAPLPTGKNGSNGAAASTFQRKALSTKEKHQQAKMAQSSDDSSSSGEEEVLESELLNVSSTMAAAPHSRVASSLLNTLFRPSSFSKHRIRPRYHMHSVEAAHEAISEAFQHRMTSKSKQNYRLLQTLPTFLSIPRVRCLASRHLERWLQSPALAGLARNILAQLVSQLRCVEPELHDDLEVIDNILKLNLKASQLPMHIDNVTAVAKNIPTQHVAQLIFTHCLQGERSSGSSSNALKPNDDHLRMLRSVYAVLDQKLAASALASSVLSCTSNTLSPSSKSGDLEVQLQNLTHLLNAVADALGSRFDIFHFAAAIIKAQSGTSNTMATVNTTARLIFECSLLTTRNLSSLQLDSMDEGELTSFRGSMLNLRKMILSWCDKDLCRAYHRRVIQEEESKCSDAYYERGAVTRGPGAPDYTSVLVDGDSSNAEGDNHVSAFRRLMSLIRCILFLPLPSSKELGSFAMAGEEMEKDRLQRIDCCCRYGVDVDDEMLQIILSSTNLTANTAISIVENLLLRCGSDCGGMISCSVGTVWRMYELTQYSPVFRSNVDGKSSSDEEESSASVAEEGDMERSVSERNQQVELDRRNLPRLAVSSLWWRVSSIALTLSGLLPNDIGAAMWRENPTVRALTKMTTSQKYRFPTADCNESEKEIVRLAEEKIKEREAKIAELLFMPQKQKKATKPKPQVLSPAHPTRGLRSSARQREKKEKQIAIEQERQAVALHAENMKLRKVLRTLQKNVMLWDPKQDSRKPPKDSIDLLLSVNERFGLADKFRLSTEPDFLLQTIGEGRSAIERAYDWLIPVISTHQGIIQRLHPSASCFLLLRAYGAEGDGNRELLELTAPLMAHVSECLAGKSGEQLLAMELLLQDIADDDDGRRRCARRVLQEAMEFGGDDGVDSSQFLHGDCGWLAHNINNHEELVPLLIKYISRALAHERGAVLGVYISALHESSKLKKDFDFVSTLCELIATRPHICCDAFDTDPCLRALAIAQVNSAFEQAIASSEAASLPAPAGVSLSIPRDGQSHSITVASNLLLASIILISNWQQKGDHDGSEAENLMRYLVIPFTPNGSSETNTFCGLSTAKHTEKKLAVSVDEWVLLAKARDEGVAEHAALSTPSMFLPRLLLCCGLPKASFHSMLKRLDLLGDSSAYEELISPTAVGGASNRRSIKRKLRGRILAYLRIHGQYQASQNSPFVSWLASEIACAHTTKDDKNQVQPPDKMAIRADAFDGSIDLMEEVESSDKARDIWQADCTEDTVKQLAPCEAMSEDFVRSCVTRNQYDVLEKALQLTSMKIICDKSIEGAAVAAKTLLAVFKSHRSDTWFVRLLLEWVPLLTQDEGDDHLWQLIFIEVPDQTLVCECALKWSCKHISPCQAWIARHAEWKNIQSLEAALRFLVVSLEQRSLHCFDRGNSTTSHFSVDRSQECAMSFTKLALTYVKLKSSGAAANGLPDEQAKKAAVERNALPDWLTLILLLGSSYLAEVSRIILDETSGCTKCPLELSCALLRLYVMNPTKMSLGDSHLRKILLDASNEHLPYWTEWRCPLDSQVSEMISNVTKNPHQRLVQSLTDIAKQHPLILVRHLNFMKDQILEDGSGRDTEQQSLVKRGRLFGRHPLGTAVARIGDNTVNVSIVFWGYSFHESVWTSILDLLMALPVEVAFGCGIKLGLTRILETYLILFVVQREEVKAENNIVRVREKFVSLLESFRRCKSEAFEDWIQRDIPHWNPVQQMLVRAGIDA